MLEKIMLKKKIWAVVGANQNPEKFGNMIYKRLKERGYETYGVNPLYDMVDGDQCYKDIASLPKVPEVIVIVISPKRAIAVIGEAAKFGCKYIWFQPGSYDNETLELAKKLGLEAVQACVLVATR